MDAGDASHLLAQLQSLPAPRGTATAGKKGARRGDDDLSARLALLHSGVEAELRARIQQLQQELAQVAPRAERFDKVKGLLTEQNKADKLYQQLEDQIVSTIQGAPAPPRKRR